MVVDMRLGADNRNKTMHKAADNVLWTYAEGSLSHTRNGVGFTLSSCDTLALCNLLTAHYDEIVQAARAEQRVEEHQKTIRQFGNDKK